MSTVVIIVLVAVLVLAVAAVGLYAVRAKGGGRNLKHRFGPEYDRVLARHNGDTRAADEELGARLDRHGSLETRELPPESRQQYTDHWAAVQERFVDSPQQAVAEAEQLLGRLAEDVGYPASQHYDDQTDALSVHHAEHVEGYRKVHSAARGEAGTEHMREALVEGRALFDALMGGPNGDDRQGPAATDSRAPQISGRHQTKGSDTA
ncbi:hypothetical protein QNO07_00575 [Streptomyces sp. 549]|uniref:hypothetical protein n=1 Tax=Streptomyces sp. 549 TaxID=3049076 RepID=UPI0024C46EBE|nr:hypothetical protein [Streptomyces sp. 549]MDK1471934.1 hypothetical protein [Streptomyces sp. 549]